jgi:1-acyl-sn-glycerol-3-phosphate acyltransferase
MVPIWCGIGITQEGILYNKRDWRRSVELPIKAAMNAKIFYPAAALIALLMIALSFVWPQGQGTRSPAPFGHAIETPDYYRMVRERDARRHKQAVERAQREKLTAAHQAAASSASASVFASDAP